MSFGVGVTDVITLSKLAWNIYKSCKESSDDFKRVSTEVASLHVILKETEEFLNEDNGLSDTRRARLGMLVETSTDVLNDLKRQLSNYESLGTHSQRTWDRLRWGLEDIAELRSRLISVNTTLTAFNSSLTNSSQARIEKRLEKFIAEVRAGLREGSVISSHHPESLDDSNSWKELQRELEDIGLSAGMVDEHQEYIKSWFKEAISSGLLREVSQNNMSSADDQGSDENDFSKPRRGRNTHLSSAATVVNDASISAESSNLLSAQTTLVERGPPSETDGSFSSPKVIRTRTLPQEIDALLSHDDPPFPDLPPPTRSDTSASHSPAALLRKKSIPSMLLFRLFQNGTKLIEAASDGSLDRVASILSLGADVNIRDKWGWSALSMAAYGGHESIAKLLLACGAETDVADVDGDTPLDLATNRGHANVVIAIEEERANRAVRGPPEPYMASAGMLRKSISKGALGRPSSSSSLSNPPSRSNTSSLTTKMDFADLTPLSRKATDALRPLSRRGTTGSSSSSSSSFVGPLSRRTTITAAVNNNNNNHHSPGESERETATKINGNSSSSSPIKPFRRTQTGGINPRLMRSSTTTTTTTGFGLGPLKKQPTFKMRVG